MYDFNQLIGQIKLDRGAHKNPAEGMCAMEFVSWLEGEKFSDSPQCTCPVIAQFVRSVNDNMNQAGRDRLITYLPRLVGTVALQHEKERAEYFAWQAIKVFAPKALRTIGLHDHAKKLIEARTLIAAADAAYAASYAAAAYADVADAVADVAAAYAARCVADAVADVAYADVAGCAVGRYAAAAANWNDIFDTLEGVLQIGPKSKGFSKPIEPTVKKAIEITKQKEAANA